MTQNIPEEILPKIDILSDWFEINYKFEEVKTNASTYSFIGEIQKFSNVQYQIAPSSIRLTLYI